jgi:hypothetical protein
VHACVGIKCRICWIGGRPRLTRDDWPSGPFDGDGMSCRVVGDLEKFSAHQFEFRSHHSHVFTHAFSLYVLF